MYMILAWGVNDFLSCVLNKNGSIRLFTLKEADNCVNQMSNSDDARVISIEGVSA